MRLSKFLDLGENAGACSALSKGWPRIALLRGSAQYTNKNKQALKEKVNNTSDSQPVTHASTNKARRCLTSVIERVPVFPAWYGR
jgi:hypothetical protein